MNGKSFIAEENCYFVVSVLDLWEGSRQKWLNYVQQDGTNSFDRSQPLFEIQRSVPVCVER